jgi:molybdopterin-guanine dinucleotide biosynthesis protein
VAIVVVGGQTRNIGKTAVVAGLIARLPEFRWTAFKITQYGHGFCTADGKPCQCQSEDACVAVSIEHDAGSGTDTSRFLAAGAMRSVWVRTRVGQLAEAMPRIREELAAAENAILESNSILDFLDPDLYLTVVDPAVGDCKVSARRWLERADAVLLASVETRGRGAAGPSGLDFGGKRRFEAAAPEPVSDALVEFVRGRLAQKIPA